MSEITLAEIVALVEGDFRGDPQRKVRGVKALADAAESDLSFLANAKYAPLLESTRAAAVLVARELEGEDDRWIRVSDPYLSLARVLTRWFSEIPRPEGISPLCHIDPSARVAATARIGPFVSIGARSVVEDEVTLFDGTFVGADCSIGRETVMHANVTIYHGTFVGRRCVLHGGVVLGGDGYGYATSEGQHHKIPQIGTVRIEDDVEIGAGSTIDRATLGETVIGEGTKIDNLVQIGHNVKIGKHCLIVSQVGISGSTEIGDHVVFGGQAGTYGHLKIGSGVQVAARAVVTKDWAEAATLGGDPARPLREQLKTEALIRRLPEIVERIERLEKSRVEVEKES